jgi:hypothetical protein
LQVLLLELNEVNFDHVRMFVDRGDLPNLTRLIESHGVVETTSEQAYEELEPWIQWVTAHSGLAFKDHGVYRLGDVVEHDIYQIWEHLEAEGLRVGAISPMNAKNRLREAAFFVPDPWTPTTISAGRLLTGVYRAVAQAVNANAQARLTLSAAMWLALGLARYARVENYATFAALAVTSPKKRWTKSMLLDLLLADIFLAETRRTRPQFASLFVNAAAHIQHHYMFNCFAYRGDQRNPEWYVAKDEDPVAEVYRLYDHIVGQVQLAFPHARLLIATGLHQEPHLNVTFYWRLKDHSAFLRKLGVPFRQVSPRMSRDFVIECASLSDAAVAERILSSAQHETGVPLFEVDNRGQDVFVMLTWPHDIGENFVYIVADQPRSGLREEVVFVAIKNGEHNGVGYLIDTGARRGQAASPMPLANLPALICEALGVKWTPPMQAAARNSV